MVMGGWKDPHVTGGAFHLYVKPFLGSLEYTMEEPVQKTRNKYPKEYSRALLLTFTSNRIHLSGDFLRGKWKHTD